MYQSLADSVPSVAERAIRVRPVGLLTYAITGDTLEVVTIAAFDRVRGFRLTELRPGAVDRARETKPAIPELGEYGIPLRDELDLEREIPPTAIH
jgi:hypothetical protein